MSDNKYRDLRFVLTLLVAAVLTGWFAMRAERVFNQAWIDYQDFKAMRVFLIQVQQQAAPKK